MEYGKAKVILRKLSTLIDSFESLGEPISEIESEMLHKYIEKLSQLIPFENDVPQASKHQSYVERKRDATANPETKSVQGEARQAIEKAGEPLKGIKIDDREKLDAKVEKKVLDVPVKKVEVEKEKLIEKANKKKKTVLVATEDDDSDGDTSDLWAPVEIKELSHKLSFSPINNIFKAISINERILTLNELFDGDSKVFKETLDHLETFDNFKEASNYLKMSVAKEYKWEDGKKIKKANNFMKIVQRRFL